MRESYIEKTVCEYAKSKNWKVYKWSSPGNKGVPDRIMIKKGTIIFIEFKATSKKPSELQKIVHSQLIDDGCKVYVIDDISKGKKLIDSY